MIRKVTIHDAKAITDIYNYYVKTSVATFEETPVEVIYFQNKIKEVIKRLPWFVFEENGEVQGYAYATQWKPRSGYVNSVEVSVYLKNDITLKGIGTVLYETLLNTLKNINIHLAIGGVCIPNDPCISLHKKFGFEKVAHFKEIGFKFNKWVDVQYWQLTLNK